VYHELRLLPACRHRYFGIALADWIQQAVATKLDYLSGGGFGGREMRRGSQVNPLAIPGGPGYKHVCALIR
jgi:hypothetical protein